MNTALASSHEVPRMVHRFERAGLGKAPFRVLGYAERKYQACPGAPIQPGTSCDFCGTACMYVALIASADGNKFQVGLDCVRRVGDEGLVASIRNSPEFRALQRQKRQARASAIKAEVTRLMAMEAVRAALGAQLASIENSILYSGNAGYARNYARIKRICAAAGVSTDGVGA